MEDRGNESESVSNANNVVTYWISDEGVKLMPWACIFGSLWWFRGCNAPESDACDGSCCLQRRGAPLRQRDKRGGGPKVEDPKGGGPKVEDPKGGGPQGGGPWKKGDEWSTIRAPTTGHRSSFVRDHRRPTCRSSVWRSEKARTAGPWWAESALGPPGPAGAWSRREGVTWKEADERGSPGSPSRGSVRLEVSSGEHAVRSGWPGDGRLRMAWVVVVLLVVSSDSTMMGQEMSKRKKTDGEAETESGKISYRSVTSCALKLGGGRGEGESLGRGRRQEDSWDGGGRTGDEMPELTGLEATCGKTEIRVRVSFSRPFAGIIYSKGFYSQPRCNYVQAEAAPANRFTFVIPSQGCGTTGQWEKLRESQDVFVENTIIIQNDPLIQEAWDHARTIRCVWKHSIVKHLSASPFQVYNPLTVPITFNKYSVNSVMEIQEGKGPFSKPATGFIHVGDQTSLVIYIQDPKGALDARVKNCRAGDSDSGTMELLDSRGCVTRQNLITPFYSTRETQGTQADLILYSHFKAFRLPSSTQFFITCKLEVCYGECIPADCAGGTANQFDEVQNSVSKRSSTSKRRRRDVEQADPSAGNRTAVVELSRGITVLPRDVSEDSRGPPADCFPRPVFMLSVSLLVLGSLLLLAFTAYLYALNRRLRAKLGLSMNRIC
ncbi:unnamed protein product [Darwinula stevensoni]|uniref:ZP domain-containing protein n=1 Tax=Darwinula stevensoni TaxID=69355 RepID=A0A7R8X667_9CRUS|nr:unnamed protein product [Darwinula stevensoni]CAG0881143.1 unnamed protein product [Darwinula stevensoni]